MSRDYCVHFYTSGSVCVCASVNLVGNVRVVCSVFSLTLTGERSGQGRESEIASELTESANTF